MPGRLGTIVDEASGKIRDGSVTKVYTDASADGSATRRACVVQPRPRSASRDAGTGGRTRELQPVVENGRIVGWFSWDRDAPTADAMARVRGYRRRVNRRVALALVGLEDPPRPDVAEVLERCRAADIRVAMVTGDHAGTAAAIAREVGLGNRIAFIGDDAEGQARLWFHKQSAPPTSARQAKTSTR